MNILFLCVGNSARSQIAEGLAKEMFPETFHVESAGSMPANSVHDGAIKCMHEIGIDISNQYPKKVEELNDAFIKNLDFVITLCAEEICPIIDKSAKRIQWPNPDPAINNITSRQQELLYRETRENIFRMLKKFFTNLN